LKEHGIDATVEDQRPLHNSVRLAVLHGSEVDFLYEVVNKAYPMPEVASSSTAIDELESDQKYHRAEVHLSQGSQNYCVMGWTREQLVTDLLEQYEKHLHFLHVLR
jgi:choline/glycine/proline betaine transport protein